MSSMLDVLYTNLELEEVASDFIETEIDTSDFMLLEPLRDHNYICLPLDDTQKPTKPGKVTKTKKTTKSTKKKRKTSQLPLYNCALCGYTTTEKDVIAKHKEVHEKIKPGMKYMPCNSCNMNSVPKDCHKCPDCSFYTKKLSSLKVHMHIHTKRLGYKCTDCKFAAKDLKELISHYETHNVEEMKSSHRCSGITLKG